MAARARYFQDIASFAVVWTIAASLVVGRFGAGDARGQGGSVSNDAESTRLPTDAAGWHKLGRECLQRNELDKAVAAFDRAIAKSPINAASYYFRAVAKEKLKQHQQALDDYSQAVRLRSGWGTACLRRGNLLVRMGELKQGLTEQKKAIRLGKFDEPGLEFIYVDQASSEVFRFIYVPSGEGTIGYDEDMRLKIVKESLQPFFGHNATPAQRVRIQQGFFLLDREITVGQYQALTARPEGQSLDKGVGVSADTPAAPASKPATSIRLPAGKDRNSAPIPAPKPGEASGVPGETPKTPAASANGPPDASNIQVPSPLDQAALAADSSAKVPAAPAPKPATSIGLPAGEDRTSAPIPAPKPGEASSVPGEPPKTPPAAPATGPPDASNMQVPSPPDQAALAADRPMCDVSWYDANQCCQRLQGRLGLVVRLPTEIEWEYAARGDAARLYPWDGEGFHAWAEHPDLSPRPFAPEDRDVSWVGAHDMAGNVSEWCSGSYRQSVFDRPSPLVLYNPLSPTSFATGAKDPKSAAGRTPKKPGPSTRLPGSGDQRKELQELNAIDQSSLTVTYRGGSYRDDRLNCQCPIRRSAIATQRDPAVGFRPVLLLKTAP
jgi:formylglycine-generating enzyme required for sulfatase activity